MSWDFRSYHFLNIKLDIDIDNSVLPPQNPAIVAYLSGGCSALAQKLGFQPGQANINDLIIDSMLPNPKHPACQQENQPHEVLVPFETIQESQCMARRCACRLSRPVSGPKVDLCDLCRDRHQHLGSRSLISGTVWVLCFVDRQVSTISLGNIAGGSSKQALP